MTDFTGGVFSIDPFLARSSPPHANDPGAWDGSKRFEDFGAQTGHAKSENRPVPVLTRALGGNTVSSYFNDYYNRVWTIPTSISLGAVTTDTHAPFRVWNAWLVPVTEESIVLGGAMDGVSISGPPTGTIYPPLALKTYSVDVLAQGAATIAGDIIMSFSSGDIKDIALAGSRAFLWAYAF